MPQPDWLANLFNPATGNTSPVPLNNRADVIYEYQIRQQREQWAHQDYIVAQQQADALALQKQQIDANTPHGSHCKTIMGFGCGVKGFTDAVSSAATTFVTTGNLYKAGAAFAAGAPSEYEQSAAFLMNRRAGAGGLNPGGTFNNTQPGGGGLFGGTIDLGAIFRGGSYGYPGTPPFVPTNNRPPAPVYAPQTQPTPPAIVPTNPYEGNPYLV